MGQFSRIHLVDAPPPADNGLHIMIISQTPPLHLTYCLNVHPGQSWADNFASIVNDAMRVRDMVCDSGMPFGLGMRLGKLAADELTRDDKLEEFRAFLTKTISTSSR